MAFLTISQVARRVGLRPSAIRYYEQIGILAPAHRLSGQRRYDEATIYRLAALQRARQIGYSLEEIRQLFWGFRDDTPPAKRWKKLAEQKLKALQQLMDELKGVQQILRTQGKCECATIEDCGKGLLRNGCGDDRPEAASTR